MSGSEKALISWADVVVAAVCSLFAFPLADASWHAIVVEGEIVPGLAGLAVSIPIGLLGLSFHFWKDKLTWLRPVADAAVYWWPIAVLLAFVYVAWPNVERRAMEAKSIANKFTQQQVQEKIAIATRPLQAQIASLQQQLRDAQQSKNATPQALPTSRPAAPDSNDTNADPEIGVWRSLNQQISDLFALLDQGDALLSTWSTDPQGSRSKAQEFAGAVSNFRLRLESLHDSLSAGYGDAAQLLQESVRSPGRAPVPGSIFDRVSRSSQEFANELASFSNLPQRDIEIRMTLPAQILTNDVKAVREWGQHIKEAAKKQVAKLSKSEAEQRPSTSR